PCLDRRDHRRVDAADSRPAPDQPGAPAHRAHRGLLHLPRVQRGRHAHPARFLGYPEGVPFTWTLRLWPHWLLLVTALLGVYFVWDSMAYTRETLGAIRRDRLQPEPLPVRGALNAVWLVGVVGALGLLRAPLREIAIVALAGLSLWRTPAAVRRANGF